MKQGGNKVLKSTYPPGKCILHLFFFTLLQWKIPIRFPIRFSFRTAQGPIGEYLFKPCSLQKSLSKSNPNSCNCRVLPLDQPRARLSTALAGDIISMLFLNPGVAIPTGIRCSEGFRKTSHSEMQFIRSKSYILYGGSVIFPTSFGDPESKRHDNPGPSSKKSVLSSKTWRK